MAKIGAFLIIVFILYSCTAELNKTLSEGGKTVTDYSTKVKERVIQWIPSMEGWFSSATDRVDEIKEKAQATIDGVKERVKTTRETYLKVQSDVEQKVEDIQNAKKQLEEAKASLEKLLGVTDSETSVDAPTRTELETLKSQVEELLEQQK